MGGPKLVRGFAVGPTEDCLRGDDPIFVLRGDLDEGGGRCEFVLFKTRRSVRIMVGSAPEPRDISMLLEDRLVTCS